MSSTELYTVRQDGAVVHEENFKNAHLGAIMVWREMVSSLPDVVVLATSLALGVTVYAGLMLLMDRRDIFEKRDFLLEMIRSRGRDDVADSVADA